MYVFIFWMSSLNIIFACFISHVIYIKICLEFSVLYANHFIIMSEVFFFLEDWAKLGRLISKISFQTCFTNAFFILFFFFVHVIRLKYCRYGVKSYTIDQSINQTINQSINHVDPFFIFRAITF